MASNAPPNYVGLEKDNGISTREGWRSNAKGLLETTGQLDVEGAKNMIVKYAAAVLSYLP
jgi:hypothetical protein